MSASVKLESLNNSGRFGHEMFLGEFRYVLIGFTLRIFRSDQTSYKLIGFGSHTNQENGSFLVRIRNFVGLKEVVYTLFVMALIFRFVAFV